MLDFPPQPFDPLNDVFFADMWWRSRERSWHPMDFDDLLATPGQGECIRRELHPPTCPVRQLDLVAARREIDALLGLKVDDPYPFASPRDDHPDVGIIAPN